MIVDLKPTCVLQSIFDLISNYEWNLVCVTHSYPYGLWTFQAGGTKLEGFLHKTLHNQRKFFEKVRMIFDTEN